MSKRNRVVRFIVFPYVAFMFLIGWGLLCCTDQKSSVKAGSLTAHLAHHMVSDEVVTSK